MQNPFLQPIEAYLKNVHFPISEYEIHRYLKKHAAAAIDALGSGRLALFRRHFLVMNALYQIQARLRKEEGLDLQISALAIRILPHAELPKDNDKYPIKIANFDDKLSRWYLDWENYWSATEKSANDLIENFWELYEEWQGRGGALRVLGLAEDASTIEIRRQYRRLVLLHHPDRGGDRRELERIQRAWEELSR